MEQDYHKKNEAMEQFLSQKREKWSENLMPLFEYLKETPTAVYEMQATALSYRHALNEEVAYFLNKLSKEMVVLRNFKKDKFIYYATGFGLKTNTGEKNVLVDGDLSENERCVELLQTHIEFLRDSVKTIDNLQYAVRNRVMLMEYLTK